MKITMVHGQNHKESTYHTGKLLAEKLGGELTEFFLPRDFGEFCTGCTTCFMKSEKLCPHYDKLSPLSEAIIKADVIILTSPVYVFHATGPMKTWLDHYGYQWMVHRPEESMFTKQGVCISTAAGGGMKSTNKDMADSLFWWGVSRVYKLGVAVNAIKYKEIPQKKKQKIEEKTTKVAKKIIRRGEKVKPGMKIRGLFEVLRLVHKKGSFNPTDSVYWKENGWTEEKRPWK